MRALDDRDRSALQARRAPSAPPRDARRLLASGLGNQALVSLLQASSPTVGRAESTHEHGCGCPRCGGTARLGALMAGDTRNHDRAELTRPEGALLQRAPARCENCGRAFDDDGVSQCPHCDSESYEHLDTELKYCPNQGCDLRGVGAEGVLCGDCGTRLVDADGLVAHDAPPEEEETLTKTERQLKAEIQKAFGWVRSSGSHHKSKGGKHTSGAREKHSGAHSTKKQVRETKSERLEELMAQLEDEKPNSSVLADAKRARGAVGSK